MDEDTERALAVLKEAGLSEDEAALFIESERKHWATQRGAAQAVRAWGDIAAACRAVQAPELAAAFIRSGMGLEATHQVLRFNMKDLTVSPLARTQIALGLVARTRQREGARA